MSRCGSGDGYGGPVIERSSSAGGPTYRPVPDVAEMLGTVVTRVHQLLRDRVVIAVRRDGIMQIPAEFVVADGDGHDVVRGLSGTITLLTDAGFSDEEIVAWLFATDAPAGPGPAPSAMDLLRSGRIKEVHRRAQVAGF